MENNTFTYQYSAKRNREIEDIRKKYLPQTESKLDRLRRLDRTVQSAGRVLSLSIGVLGALIFGIGLCFGLDALVGADWLPPLLCILGTLVMLPAYPIYLARSERKYRQLAPEILRLSDELASPDRKD